MCSHICAHALVDVCVWICVYVCTHVYVCVHKGIPSLDTASLLESYSLHMVFCADVVDFARLYMCEKLEKKSLQVIKQRFPLVVDSVSFLHLSLERLEEILSFTDLTLGKLLWNCGFFLRGGGGGRVCGCVYMLEQILSFSDLPLGNLLWRGGCVHVSVCVVVCVCTCLSRFYASLTSHWEPCSGCCEICVCACTSVCVCVCVCVCMFLCVWLCVCVHA